jgi:hypothetical protein
MMVALISTTALLLYFKNKYLLLALALSFGVLVKESMIISAAFLGLVYFIEQIRLNTLRVNFSKILLFTLPLLVFILFLVIQKAQNGWYFFPYHTEIIQENAFSGFFEKLQTHYTFIFYKQGRNQWIFGLLLALISMPLIKRNTKLGILMLYFCFGLGLFSFAFYLDRYLLFLYPILVIMVVRGVYIVCLKRNSLSFALTSVLILLSLMSLNESKFRYDASLSYEDVVSIHKEAVNKLCHAQESELKCFTNFPINISLWDSRLGYVDSACQQKIHTVNEVSQANYLILFNTSYQAKDFQLLNTFQKNEVSITYYKRL